MSASGFIVAASRSGAGKTTVALGLMRALSMRGLAVQPFKCGPDYIDPAFHTVATGRTSFNLDSWAMPEAMIAGLVAEHADADIAVVEGVMGLFDGAARSGLAGGGATADLAALLGWPVILVLDVSGQTETAAAVALGCASYRADVRIVGVILNRVASPRHAALIAPAFERIGIPLFGALPRDAGLVLPERHLGLVQAGEHAALSEHLDRLADATSRFLDLDAIAAAATSVSNPEISARSAATEPCCRRRASASRLHATRHSLSSIRMSFAAGERPVLRSCRFHLWQTRRRTAVPTPSGFLVATPSCTPARFRHVRRLVRGSAASQPAMCRSTASAGGIWCSARDWKMPKGDAMP